MVADALQLAVEISKISEMDRGKSTEGSLATRCDRAAAALQSGRRTALFRFDNSFFAES